MGGAYGLDFGAALALGRAKDVRMDLLADVLPAVEGALLRRANGGADEAGGDQEA